jgi:hypothetical protein
MQVEGGGMGYGPVCFVYLKNLNFVVPIKTRDLVPPLTKAQRTFISAISIGFQIANQKSRRRSKTLRALTEWGLANCAKS